MVYIFCRTGQVGLGVGSWPSNRATSSPYLTEMSRFLWENSLLISAPKSSVTLFTPDPSQANTHPKIKIADSEIPLVRSPKLLGVYLDTFFSFNKHCVQVANRVSKRNNVLKALVGTNWGQQKETTDDI